VSIENARENLVAETAASSFSIKISNEAQRKLETKYALSLN